MQANREEGREGRDVPAGRCLSPGTGADSSQALPSPGLLSVGLRSSVSGASLYPPHSHKTGRGYQAGALHAAGKPPWQSWGFVPASRLLCQANVAARSTADPRPVLQQEPCLSLFSVAVCCVQEGGEHSLLHPCSVQQCHKAQGLRIWAMLHIASVEPCWVPGGHSVSPIKGKALLQPPFLVPRRWGGKGLALA